ncbi:MFS transporter [Actinophytocola oryzae]|uniref:MFS transporter n=1 Tax=Actinophytocola oryzae TaxID=502181 RepID=A0A4R7W577_9PSEU|nr:MFS transporter [Actinophytocola oryzae]TDV57893.1 MFS transporter [Actinophytocola oryzae]
MTAVEPPRTRARGRRITFYVALAAFAQESTWNFYDAQVPPLLREHLSSAALIGLLMGMDNILGIVIQPWMGNRSDNTRTRWGRRIPYLAVGMPVAALLFATIPLASTLPVLIALMFAYTLVANSFKPVGDSLLPDFIRPERRSRANAVVKIAISLTVIVSALISTFLVDSHPVLSFWIPSALMLGCAAVLVLRVRDNTSPAYEAAVAEERRPDAGDSARMREVLRDIAVDPDRGRVLVILVIFLFGCAWFSSRSLITTYGMETLGLSRGDAGGLTLLSGVAYLLAAFPLALLSERVGRLRVMAFGMALFAVSLVAGTLVHTETGTVVALCAGAAGAAGFAINGAVVLWNMAPSSRVLGTYTGLYTVGWMSGGFVGPAVVGGVVDLTGWRFMLVDTAVLAALAVVVALRIQASRRDGATL